MTTRNRDLKDDTTLERTIFGHSLVSSHSDFKGNSYRFYGHYQRSDANEGEKFPRTSRDSGTASTDIQDFCLAIGSQRKETSEDKGLSIFIPWYEEEISFETITTSVIENYSVAFQMGLLEVQIKNSTETLEISNTNIQDCIDKLSVDEDQKSLLTALNRLASKQDPKDVFELYKR